MNLRVPASARGPAQNEQPPMPPPPRQLPTPAPPPEVPRCHTSSQQTISLHRQLSQSVASCATGETSVAILVMSVDSQMVTVVTAESWRKIKSGEIKRQAVLDWSRGFGREALVTRPWSQGLGCEALVVRPLVVRCWPRGSGREALVARPWSRSLWLRGLW